MTTPACSAVLERLATGTALDDLATHVASCARCTAITHVPGDLAHAQDAAFEPGPGFVARMTQGAQRSLRERRRNRLAGAGLATACAALAGVIIATRAPDRRAQLAQTPVHAPVPVTSATELAIDRPPTDPASAATTHLAHDLAQWRAAARGHRSSSHWRTVERAMTRYDLLVRTHAPAAARGPGDNP